MPIGGRLLLEVLWYIFQILTCQYITIQYSYYPYKHVVVNLFSMLRCIDFLLETYQTIVVIEYQTKLTTIPGLSQWHHWHQDIVRVSVTMNIWCDKFMMPSSKGNIFHVTGPLWEESPVNSPHKGQWRGALMLSLICTWTNGWVNNRGTGDFRRHRPHYNFTVM